MKILCKYSGIQFDVSHFPFTLESREIAHPVFAIPQQKLIVALAKKWPDELTPMDSYLGFLSLLHSTGKIDWKVPCIYSPQIDPIIAANMPALIKTVGIISSVTHPAFTYPAFVISPDTRNLATVKHWIELWQSCYIQFQEGNKRAQLHDRIVRREQAMERLIKDPSKNTANYANQLAEWAALAGAFPTGTVPVDGQQISLADYWKGMIRKAARGEAVFTLNDVDLQELIEHCENEIEHGSIYSYTLMKVLRDAQERKRNFLGLGDLDIQTSTYRILSKEDTVERANILAMIDSAPTTKPIESNYPDKVSYLRAMFKWKAWDLYQKQGGDGSNGQDPTIGLSAASTMTKLGE